MKYDKNGKIKGPIIVKIEEFNELIKFLEQDFTTFSISATLKDKTKCSFSSLNEFTSYSNLEKRKIVDFELSCIGDKKSLRIDFEQDRYIFYPEVVSYFLRYEDSEWGFKFEDDLIQQIKFLRPFLSFKSYLNLTFCIPIFILLISFVISLYNDLFFDTSPNLVVNSRRNESEFILVISLSFILGFFLEKLKKYLFPSLYITFGKQLKEYENRINIGKYIFVAVITAGLINWFFVK